MTFLETILNGLCLNIVMFLLFYASTAAGNDDDASLVIKAKRGNREAFDVLLEKYYKKVYNLAYRYVGEQEEASDLTQEIFTAAFQNLRKFRGDSKFSTWLFQIATNRGKKPIQISETAWLLCKQRSDREQRGQRRTTAYCA